MPPKFYVHFFFFSQSKICVRPEVTKIRTEHMQPKHEAFAVQFFKFPHLVLPSYLLDLNAFHNTVYLQISVTYVHIPTRRPGLSQAQRIDKTGKGFLLYPVVSTSTLTESFTIRNKQEQDRQRLLIVLYLSQQCNFPIVSLRAQLVN